MNDVPLALAFGAGLVATVNPCGFAMLPSVLTYYLGQSGPRRTDGTGRVADGLLVGLVLSAGFMLLFGVVGIAFALGAQPVVRIVPWVTIVVGGILIALGLWLLAGKKLTLRLPGLAGPKDSGYRSMFLFGIAYAIGSLSCTLPIFLVMVGSALATGSALGTLASFLAYGLGMSTVLMLLCLGTAGFREVVLRALRPLFPHMGRISGALLVLGGGYVVYYWASLLGGNDDGPAIRFVQDLQRGAQDLVTRPSAAVWLAAGVALLVAALLALVLRAGGLEAADVEEQTEETKTITGGARGAED